LIYCHKKFTSTLSNEYNFERSVSVRFCAALFLGFRLPKCLNFTSIMRYSFLNICETLCFSLIKLSYKSLSQHNISGGRLLKYLVCLIDSLKFTCNCQLNIHPNLPDLQLNFIASSDRAVAENRLCCLNHSKVSCLSGHEQWKRHGLIYQRWYLLQTT